MQPINKKVIISTIIVFFLVIGLGVASYLVRQNQDLRKDAAAATNIFISPSSQQATVGSNVTFRVRLNTGSNLVTAVDTKLNYNPNALEIISVARGGGATNLDQTAESLNYIDNSAGKLSHIIFTLDKSKYITGSNIEILVVSAKIKNNAPLGSHTISFDQTTSASAVNESIDVINLKTSGTITALALPTATPTATATATATATSTATATATAQPRRGDVNGDGIVNIIDIGIIIDHYGSQPPTDIRADLDGSGRIDIVDIGIVIDNYDL